MDLSPDSSPSTDSSTTSLEPLFSGQTDTDFMFESILIIIIS